jgi:hypothetical protein
VSIFKRNRKPNDDTPKSQPPPMMPLGSFAIPMDQIIAAMRQAQQNQPPFIDAVLEEIKSDASVVGTYWHLRGDYETCSEGHRDHLIITSRKTVDDEPRRLGLAVVDECAREIVFGVYDLDTLRDFVNQLSHAIDREARR